MLYKAKVDFGGIISMSVGDVGEIADESIAKDLLSAGYIEKVGPAEKVETPKKAEQKETEEPKTPKKTTNRKPATRAKKSGVK